MALGAWEPQLPHPILLAQYKEYFLLVDQTSLGLAPWGLLPGRFGKRLTGQNWSDPPPPWLFRYGRIREDMSPEPEEWEG